MTEIHPGRHRSQAQVRPENSSLHFSRIPLSQIREWAPVEHDDPHEAYWCTVDRFWKRKERNITPEPSRPTRNPAVPIPDASGVHWRVVCAQTGATLWRIEAGDFDRALAEKRRLCRIAGFRSGHAYLKSEAHGPRPAIQRAPVPAPSRVRVTSEGGSRADGRISGRLSLTKV